ncbi:acyl-CoA dehydrogenase family protein [Streptomyces spirodelae]|uniref:Acyl-CoA dehydrogenase family protein n=1 Tax=Streptomyces spirodelae TaxID=2812904 RepID=A0ABS3WTV6_9ACTN|nr:acyl-CoA dehydrogenase family protein [Streptomyces spirodelae]MBO8186570.1 acyl-CoA dehydrogenase family protein [Streptomyces spirodelae]
MDFGFTREDEDFRAEARQWLHDHLTGDFAGATGEGGPGREHQATVVRRRWERELGAAGWIGIGWDPRHGSYGNRTATLTQQVVWAEEYARAGAPARVGHIGENLLAPTLLAHGTAEQRQRFLPAIARGEELWCQGYSEPDAGSDLAAVRTTAVRTSAVRATAVRAGGVRADGVRTGTVGGLGAGGGAGGYRVTGQKIWTSLAQEADWCFVLARTEQGTSGHRGLSFLLVPMDQPGRVEVRPIRQMSGTEEFNEVFFDGALAEAGHRVGAEGDGWRVATSLLALERGVSTLAQQIGFAAELDRVLRLALRTGAAADPVLRDRLVRAWSQLRVMRWNALRTLGGTGSGTGTGAGAGTATGTGAGSDSGTRTGSGSRTTTDGSGDAAVPGAPSVAKLLWGCWHQQLGELAVLVRGAPAALGPYDWTPHRPYELDALQRLFLFTRADTIYGGSDEIQRDILAQQVLGLPREART